MYRGFIKPINALGGLPYGSADLRIQDMTIKRDILTKASSTFTVLDIPDEAEVGNVFGCYDNAGKVVYVGVITNIDDKTIQTDQIISIFNDNWKYRDPTYVSTIEGKIKDIIDGFGADYDTLLASIFSQFTTTTLTSTTIDLPTQNKNYVTNLMNFLFKVYENYQILVDINIAINQTNPTINIYRVNDLPNPYPVLLLSDNNNALRNFNVIKETYETNKLMLYSGDGSYRGTWYGTPTGITTDSTQDRLPKIRTNIVFSDDDYTTVVADNLTQEMYNHKIELELVLNNKLYDFETFHLGQSFNIYYEKKTYASILTGYEIKVNQNGASDVIKLVFGIVRVSLVDKLNKLVKSQQNLSSEEIRNEITSANVTNALGYTPAHELEYTPGSDGYGSCSTAAATARKTVTVTPEFKLQVGSIVGVLFTNTNTANNPTLNVNNTGAKSIVYNTGVITTSNLSYAGYASRTIYYMYDGTYWRFLSCDYDANTTYSVISEANIKSSTHQTGSLITGQRFSQGFNALLTSSAITSALGYTPYNSTNPNGYITGITSANVINALGYTPYNSSNPNHYITGITSSNVISALGYTPYNSTNPNHYISGINYNDVISALGYTPSAGTANVYRANGEGSDFTINDGVIDLVPITATGAVKSGSGMTESTYGIKVSSAGIYKVTGSVYMNAPTAAYSCGVYLKKSANGGAYAGSTELGGALTPKPTTQAFTGAVQFAPNIYSLSANDVIYLAARIRGASGGTIYTTNTMTYLLVEKIS